MDVHKDQDGKGLAAVVVVAVTGTVGDTVIAAVSVAVAETVAIAADHHH